MGIYKAESIVLRSRVDGEADRILICIPEKKERFQPLQGGAQDHQPPAGAVQLFTHTHLVLYSGRSLDTEFSQGDAEEHFSYLEQDLERFTQPATVLKLVDRLTEAREQQPKVFLLCSSALGALKNGNPELTARVFELKLLDILVCPSNRTRSKGKINHFLQKTERGKTGLVQY